MSSSSSSPAPVDARGGLSPEEPPATPPGRPRALGRVVRPVRGRLLLGAVLSALGGVAGLLPFIAVAQIARELLTAAAVEDARVWPWIAIGAAGALGRVGLHAAGGLVTHYADADLQRGLRERIARHLATVPMGWFLGRGSGDVKKALGDDVDDLHGLVAHALNDLATGCAVPVAAVTYLAVVDLPMTAVTLTPMGLAMLLVARAHRTLPERMAQLVDAELRINGAAIEYVDGIEAVKSYRGGRRAHERFSTAVDDYCGALAAWSAVSARSLFAALALLSPAFVLMVVLAAGTGFIALDWLAPIDLLPFLLIGVGLMAPYLTIVSGTLDLRRARAAAAHIEQVLGEPALPEPTQARLPATHGITFDRVRFSYDGATDVLREVSLTCEADTVTALVGPSGSGKTTLTRLVPRFLDVTAGCVRIGGVDVREMPSRELLRLVAIVFQDVVLLRDTVRENIRLGRPGARDDEVVTAARAARIHERILSLAGGYDAVLDEHGGGLSKGERQRLTIARAILQDAPIVLLDEATASVDPENEASIQAAIAELIAGRTLIVVAHRLYTIERADQIVVMQAGAIVERGRHRELLERNGAYAAMWRAQQPATTAREWEPAR